MVPAQNNNRFDKDIKILITAINQSCIQPSDGGLDGDLTYRFIEQYTDRIIFQLQEDSADSAAGLASTQIEDKPRVGRPKGSVKV